MIWASLVAQTLQHRPAMQKTQVRSLGQEEPLEKEMASHFSVLAWRIPWTEEPGGLRSLESQRVRHNWATNTHKILYVCVCTCTCVQRHFSHAQLFVTLWTIAHQAPLSMGFSRQEYWSGLPCSPPGNLPDPGIRPASLMSSALAVGFWPLAPPGKYVYIYKHTHVCICMYMYRL